jgi:hypothetical protein
VSGDLAKTCALLSALTVSSCSVLLDWSGYTGGGASSHPDASMGGDDAMTQDDANDAADDLAVGSMDATQDASGPADATNDVADARAALEASSPQDADSSAGPMCSSSVCGGCCVPSGNFCSGGSADKTCGVSGQPCTDCTAQGFVCDKASGQCKSPPADAGMQGPCVVSFCTGLHRCITVNNFQMACCRPDNFCGCQVVFDPTNTCI